jgi:hypothetical protein
MYTGRQLKQWSSSEGHISTSGEWDQWLCLNRDLPWTLNDLSCLITCNHCVISNAHTFRLILSNGVSLPVKRISDKIGIENVSRFFTVLKRVSLFNIPMIARAQIFNLRPTERRDFGYHNDFTFWAEFCSWEKNLKTMHGTTFLCYFRNRVLVTPWRGVCGWGGGRGGLCACRSIVLTNWLISIKHDVNIKLLEGTPRL